MKCWFQTLFPHECEWRFDGQPDRIHFIPQVRIKNAGQREHVWDERIWRPGCRAIHRRLDGFDACNKLEFTYDQFPESVLDFAAELGWWWAGPRDGWLKEAKAA